MHPVFHFLLIFSSALKCCRFSYWICCLRGLLSNAEQSQIKINTPDRHNGHTSHCLFFCSYSFSLAFFSTFLFLILPNATQSQTKTNTLNHDTSHISLFTSILLSASTCIPVSFGSAFTYSHSSCRPTVTNKD